METISIVIPGIYQYNPAVDNVYEKLFLNLYSDATPFVIMD